MPLESGGEHGDEVQLEVRLASRSEGIKASVDFLGLLVCGVLLESLINTREADEFKQTTAQWAGLVASVGSDGTLLSGTSTEEVVVQSVTILETENEGYDGVIKQVLSNMRTVEDERDAVLLELSGRANTREHEKLGGLEDTLGDNDFVLGGKGDLLTSDRVDHDNTSASLGGGVDDEVLGLDGREDGDVGLALEEQETSLTGSLIDGITTVSQTSHGTGVDIFGKGVSFAGPTLDKCITEGLHLRNELGVGDVDGTASSNLGELSWVELVIVVISCALSNTD